jgi:hypothetical protein
VEIKFKWELELGSKDCQGVREKGILGVIYIKARKKWASFFFYSLFLCVGYSSVVWDSSFHLLS